MREIIWDTPRIPKNQLFKTLVYMKLSAILVLLLSLQISAKVHSQSITLKMSNATLSDALSQIESKTAYRVIFSNDILPENKLVTINVTNENIETVLNEILEETNLTYK